MIRYVLLWFPLLVLAFANGTLRVLVYAKHMGELRAHQLSSLTGIILLGIAMWWIVRRWPPESPAQAAWVGAVWVAMTVAFEFLFRHYAGGQPWSRLLQDYNLMAGRVWALVLLWIGVAPGLFHLLRR